MLSSGVRRRGSKHCGVSNGGPIRPRPIPEVNHSVKIIRGKSHFYANSEFPLINKNSKNQNNNPKERIFKERGFFKRERLNSIDVSSFSSHFNSSSLIKTRLAFTASAGIQLCLNNDSFVSWCIRKIKTKLRFSLDQEKHIQFLPFLMACRYFSNQS